MTVDPEALLAWMRSRGRGEIAARAISDAGPRPFRRRAAADNALKALIDAGHIVEVRKRPRAFRVTDFDNTATPPETVATPLLIPAVEIRELFASRIDHHACLGLSDAVARYLAGRDVYDALRRDPRLVSDEVSEGNARVAACHVCGGRDDGTFLRVGGRLLMHARCLGLYRAAVAERVDSLVVAAIG